MSQVLEFEEIFQLTVPRQHGGQSCPVYSENSAFDGAKLGVKFCAMSKVSLYLVVVPILQINGHDECNESLPGFKL